MISMRYNVSVFVGVTIYIYIYIYREREREREYLNLSQRENLSNSSYAHDQNKIKRSETYIIMYI